MKSSLFFVDSTNDQAITWQQLISDINEVKEYNTICLECSFYDIFLKIIVSLLLDREIIILDSDFSDIEINKLLGSSISDKNNKSIDVQQFNIQDETSLINAISEPKKNWGITLFTSGTTGLPKKITHDFDSITRFVKKSDNRISNIWGFAYNPTHMAGIQVFFQALLNNNTIIRLFGLSKESIFTLIEEYNISNISATPTFYRLLLPYNGVFSSVVRLTSGGEKFDSNVQSQLKQLMPNAKITNVYASTELGSLFASDGDVFIVKDNIRPFVRINEGELLVHKSLMGKTEFSLDEDFYSTGDLVAIVSEDPLCFSIISRKNEMINVGGYKVNPSEVEEVIRTISGIREVRVFAKANSVLGNIIVAEVVSNDSLLSEPKIRAILSEMLQEYKVPRIIKFVNKIDLTRTGKIKR